LKFKDDNFSKGNESPNDHNSTLWKQEETTINGFISTAIGSNFKKISTKIYKYDNQIQNLHTITSKKIAKLKSENNDIQRQTTKKTQWSWIKTKAFGNNINAAGLKNIDSNDISFWLNWII
jgi:hypothetical protein